MSKKSHIRKSVYNQGRLEIDHILPNEVALSKLTFQRDRIKHAFENLLQHDDIKPGSLNIYSSYYFPSDAVENSTPKWDPSCSVTLEQVLNRVIHSYPQLERSYYVGSYACLHHDFFSNHPSNRISTINEELRTLKLELKKKFSTQLLNKIRKLVQELYSIISFFFTKQRKYVKCLRVSLYGSLIRDIRKTYRHTIQIIFKNLPDFSGCEEEAKFTTIVNFKPLFLNKQNNHVQYKVFT